MNLFDGGYPMRDDHVDPDDGIQRVMKKFNWSRKKAEYCLGIVDEAEARLSTSETVNRNIFYIHNRSEVLSLTVQRHDGHDLDETTAREQAELHLRERKELDGWGGKWSFSGTYRISYDRVRVEFEV